MKTNGHHAGRIYDPKYFDIDKSVMDEIGLTTFAILDALTRLSEPHRFYHNLDYHISKLFDCINASEKSRREKSVLKVIALFHDIIYIPFYKKNEVASSEYFMNAINNNGSELAGIIATAIEDTEVAKNELRNKYSTAFSFFDLYDLEFGSPAVWIENSNRLFKEFQYHSWPDFRKHNIEFLSNLGKTHPQLKAGCDFQVESLKTFKPRIGLYAGSFNPFHIGHMDVLEQAEGIFDKVIVAAGRNMQKTNIPKFQPHNFLPFHETFTYYDLLSDLIKAHSKYADIVLVRGLRSGYDLNYEEKLLRHLQDDIPDVKAVYVCCKASLGHVSSSSVREIGMYDKNKAKKYLPSKFNYYKEKYSGLDI